MNNPNTKRIPNETGWDGTKQEGTGRDKPGKIDAWTEKHVISPTTTNDCKHP